MEYVRPLYDCRWYHITCSDLTPDRVFGDKTGFPRQVFLVRSGAGHLTGLKEKPVKWRMDIPV